LSNFRPASPDGEPILGPGTIPGLYYATGHTRNGILLAPVTADAIAAAVLGRPAPVDLAPFSPARLAATPGRAR
jgi:glycine oxidase